MAIRLDHLVIGARSLLEGVAWAERRLGVAPAGGGRHAAMGTQNALWGLGPVYLEVIAVDPEAVRPDRPRWFGFDDPRIAAALEAGPKLLTWAVAADTAEELTALVDRAPVALAPPEPFARDDLRWLVALAEERALPLGGAWPLAICWTEGLHPAKRLPDRGLSLEALEIAGAGAAEAEAALGPVEAPAPIAFRPGAAPTVLRATLRTPGGTVGL